MNYDIHRQVTDNSLGSHELYRWRSDWWYYCSCEDYRYIYGDNKSNSRTLLDTMSKGVKEKRAIKKTLSIINNTSTCHLEHIP